MTGLRGWSCATGQASRGVSTRHAGVRAPLVGLALVVAASLAAAPYELQTPRGPGPFVTVLAVHGGGWTSGTPADTAPFCRAVLEAGFACAALDYRLAPQTPFPGQIDDLTRAIHDLMRDAARLRLNPAGVVLAGESAGGHLAAFLGAEHPSTLPILGVIAFSPPLDLEALGEPGRALGITPPEVRALTGAAGWSASDIERMRRASPVDAIRPGAPPFLIVFGTADSLVPPSQARGFCDRLRHTGGSCQLLPIPGAPHGLWAEDRFERWKSVWYPTLIDWIQRLAAPPLPKTPDPR